MDIRTFIGHDVCDYPDSNRVLLVPSMERFRKEAATNLFDGEENVTQKWKELQNDSE
ncbi:MAG: hypothetical protein LUD68_10925 [Rikenellaceae bacterium]|nr:hypothetical protein [Rikenellaceae bacterium]